MLQGGKVRDHRPADRVRPRERNGLARVHVADEAAVLEAVWAIALKRSHGFTDLAATAVGVVEADAVPTARLHLYGKRDARPGRKMGHLSAVGATAAEALARVQDAYDRFRPPGVAPIPRA